MHPVFKIFCSVVAVITLAGCMTTSGPADSAGPDMDRLNKALNKAAMSAAARGEPGQSLAYLEKAYKRQPDNIDSARAYAAALRHHNHLLKASKVLQPLAGQAASPSTLKSEYAGILLAQGRYEEAERYALKAISQDDRNAQAYHFLGIASDALGEHVKAERAYLKGLDLWQGDTSSIMNNLALNMALQGRLEQANDLLVRAHLTAPQRPDIENNLDIVQRLRQMNKHHMKTPTPDHKPDNPS